MYSFIVFLPLLGSLIAGFLGHRLRDGMLELITSSFLTIAAILSWIAFFQIGVFNETLHIPIAHWIQSGDMHIDWTLRIDTLTVIMFVVVNSVSALVHWYSIGYMSDDPHRSRFFSYLSLFTFAMLVLVTSDNLVQMFFGWEGVGLASYLLIGFWYKRASANAAAMKAFLVNRVGDFGFAIGIFAIFSVFGSLDFDNIFAGAADLSFLVEQSHVAGTVLPEASLTQFVFWQVDTLTMICLLLFMGAMGKSAQFLLHTWLPDAMEGPTPVSALIHAATMVTAGVFMIARLSPLFVLSPDAMTIITFVGATTALFAASVGLVQNDIKRVIAYSTCSQLGYMFAALGVGAFSVAIFHLFTHAFFKALLFLGAGSVIHAASGEQDMQNLGGLKDRIPVTYWMMLIGTLALTGFPLTAGYFSKDAIIESVYAANSSVGFYAFLMLSLAAVLTAFYSWRLIFLTFHGSSRLSSKVQENIHESPVIMLVPLYVLAVGALIAGGIFKIFFIGHDHEHFWGKSIFLAKDIEILNAMHHVPAIVAWIPMFAMISGFVIAWCLYLKWINIPVILARRCTFLYRFLLNKWYFDELYDMLFTRPSVFIGRFLYKWGDGFMIDGFGPNAIAARTLDVTRLFLRLQTGYIYHYAFAMLIGVTAFITWCIFAGSFY